MKLSNLLVAYNGSESSDAALDAAIFLQQKFDAHLTGLLAAPSRLDVQQKGWLPKNVQQTILALDRKNVQMIADQFANKTKHITDQKKVHWIAQRGDSDRMVSDYAQMFDLTIIGRRDAVFADKRFELHPDRIALKSGRPILVIPRSWDQEKILSHALLAWDGKRSAARALTDAMGLFEKDQMVTVMSVKKGQLMPPLDGIDVETVLSRHNFASKRLFVDSNSKKIADVILEESSNLGAGLLVMGAYEHSKFREDIFGGVTNRVLEKSDIPIFLSH